MLLVIGGITSAKVLPLMSSRSTMTIFASKVSGGLGQVQVTGEKVEWRKDTSANLSRRPIVVYAVYWRVAWGDPPEMWQDVKLVNFMGHECAWSWRRMWYTMLHCLGTVLHAIDIGRGEAGCIWVYSVWQSKWHTGTGWSVMSFKSWAGGKTLCK